MKAVLVLAACLSVSLATDIHRRVVGGSQATRGDNPYIVNLEVGGDNGYTYRCSGALIGDRWVVTAAHCIQGSRPDSLRAVLGDYYRSRNDGSEQIINVDDVFANPHYAARAGYPSDVGLVRLARPANFNRAVQPISLPSAGQDFNGASCYIVGWGRTSANSGNSDVLRRARVKGISNGACSRNWNGVKGAAIFKSHLCAGSTGIQPCNGDNGSPLVCGGVLAGVTSWGAASCAGNRPAVFTRVTSFLPWIRSVMA